MTRNVQQLLTEHIDLWTSATENKSSAGRGNSRKKSLYGIKKLRELILELAVRGKLVEQDSNDEPASELLKRIAAERDRLVEAGEIKKPKKLSEISDEEKAFELPNEWEWVRFGDIAQHNSGKTLDKGRNLGIPRPYLTTSNLYWGRFELNNVREMLIRDEELDKCSATKGDLLICEGGDAGRAAVWASEDDVCFQNHIHRARFLCNIDPYYAFRTFEKLSATGEIDTYRKGVGISNMSGKALASVVFPLPPLPEQHRIVAKVDELMALCDQLEQQTEQQLDAHQLLVDTLLGTLTQSQNANELADNWTRLSQHFDTLFTTEASIDQLKQTILQLAVMGKLVPQNPSDEPASELLKRIAAEKEQLIKDKKIKKQKPLPPISDEEKPFELPEGWEWIRTGEAGDIKLGRQRSPKDHFGPHMTPYLRVANVYDNRIDTSDVKKMNFTPKEQEIFRLKYGDILLNEGQSKELVGRPAMYRNEVEGACFQNTLLRFQTYEGISPEYALLYFRNCLYSGRFQRAVKQTTNMAHLSASRLIPIEFPLPPLEDQNRIVTKVDELFLLCDLLKERLQHNQQTQLLLTDTLVQEALV